MKETGNRHQNLRGCYVSINYNVLQISASFDCLIKYSRRINITTYFEPDSDPDIYCMSITVCVPKYLYSNDRVLETYVDMYSDGFLEGMGTGWHADQKCAHFSVELTGNFMLRHVHISVVRA